MLISNDNALQQLMSTAGYEVAKAVLKPKGSGATINTLNAAARTDVGIPRKQLVSIIQQLTDISDIQAERVIDILIAQKKLIRVPKAYFEEDDDTIVLS